ncbi:MAG: aspartate 1-decarboxylase [Candidatus Omnitrophica bacterium CG11_big_fil_rev_8_21_14_0_20_43_6]|nr:MAG: aspartate 1-decarboxylase [Candidatus Omnitrophica bacterium CG11_big_fil_rev_8_21_14_0_20_43_6]
MLRTMLKSKIHRATVTESNLNYEGSITIDADLVRAADLLEHEKVEIFNINNGQRIETYVIKGKASSGVICLNGAAARGACPGDQVIIVSYVAVEDKQVQDIKARIIKVDDRNKIKN